MDRIYGIGALQDKVTMAIHLSLLPQNQRPAFSVFDIRYSVFDILITNTEYRNKEPASIIHPQIPGSHSCLGIVLVHNPPLLVDALLMDRFEK